MQDGSILEYIEEKESRGVDPEDLGVDSWREVQTIIQRAVTEHKAAPEHRKLIEDYMNYTRRSNPEPTSKPKVKKEEPQRIESRIGDFGQSQPGISSNVGDFSG